MTEENKLVVPGEMIATCEEFVPGRGTYEDNGEIFAKFAGMIKINGRDKSVTVEPLNPTAELRNGDMVFAVVTSTRDSMATADVFRKDGVDRGVTGDIFGSLHVSKISDKYSESVKNEFGIGDIIRAKVLQTKPSLQLATDRQHFGVVAAFCKKCRASMKRRNDGRLICINCERIDVRKLADDFGEVKGI